MLQIAHFSCMLVDIQDILSKGVISKTLYDVFSNRTISCMLHFLCLLTCTVKLVESIDRRRTSAKAKVKPFSILSLKLQKRTSM